MPGFISQGIGDSSRQGSVHPVGTEEFYYSYTWEIPNLFVGASSVGYNPSTNPQLIYLKDATLPTFSVAKESVVGASVEYKFAKHVTFDDVRVTWYDTQGLISVIRKWREMVWTPESGIKTANEYKHHSYLVTYLPSGYGAVFYKLVNSWPSVIRHGDLTYTGSDVKIVEVTITYDWAFENSTDMDNGGGTTPTTPQGETTIHSPEPENLVSPSSAV